MFWEAESMFGKSAIIALLLGCCLVGQTTGDDEPSPAPPAEQPATTTPPERAKATPSATRTWFRLVNVNIPPDSKHRRNDRLDWPPQIYVVLEKNGTQVGNASTSKTGWSVDFPNQEQNGWPIWEGTNDRYSIQVWDYNPILNDQLIVSITDLSGEDFREAIREIGSELEDMSRLVQLLFEPTTTPEGRK